jgi:hypothetical protein
MVCDLVSYAEEIAREAGVARLAKRHNGNVSREQLLALGFSDTVITRRCRQQRWFRVHLGVYAIGRPPVTPVEKASAAVLAGGEAAALSHQSALSLWGLLPRWSFPLHVSCARHVRRPGIVTHRAAGLTRIDIRFQLGVRVTSPARTVLDTAVELGQQKTSRLMGEARRRGYLHVDQIADVLARFPRHPGRTVMLEALGGLEQPTRSELEQAFLAFCRRYGLPTPLVNTRPGRHECDFVFPDAKLVVELDGWDFHRDKHMFESDRDRDADMLLLEHATLRMTWARLMYGPEREARRLRQIIAQRSR